MADSLFTSLLNMVDSRTIGEVAHLLGQPEQSVARGMESSIASVLGGLSKKANDPGALRKMLDTVPSAASPVSWSQAASGIAEPNSSLLAAGTRLLSALFGGGANTVTSGISRASGLSSGAVTTLLTMAGPVVMTFIARHVRDNGMNMNGLGALLQRESGTFRSAVPAGLSEVFWPGAKTTVDVSPVVAQTVTKESSPNWLLPLLAAAALGLGLFWLLSHAHRPAAPQVAIRVPTGEANRLATPPLTTTSPCNLPASVVLPEGSVGAKMLAFLQNPDAKMTGTWFNADQLNFNTGSAKLRPDSQAQLRNIASILTNCPGVRLAVAGYTDNVGNADANLRLSRNRADMVVGDLISKGVSRDRLTAEGYGEENPIATNDTAQGRAENRRIAMQVTGR